MPRVFCGVDPAKTVWLLPRLIAICYPCVQRLFRRISQPANDLCDGLRCIIHCECLFLLLPCVHNPFLSPCPGFCPQAPNDERKDEYVRALYTEGLFAEFYKAGTKEHIGYHATHAGLTVYDGNYLTRKAESVFSWSLTRELIEALIADKNYLDTPLEKASAQISLFDEPAGKEETPLRNAAGQFAVSQEVIDAFLRLGGATKGSSQRIYCFYRRANDPKENIEFLKREYGRDAIGLLLGGRKAAAAWDDNGVRIAEGESVSDAKDSILLSWEAVDKRIRELLESGQYLSDFEAETAENEWNRYVGDKLGFLYWDQFESIPE